MQQMEHASSGAGAPLSAAAEPAVALSTCAGALVGAGEPAADGVCDTGARDGDGDGDTDSAIADGDSAVPLPGLVADTDGDDEGRADGEAASGGGAVGKSHRCGRPELELPATRRGSARWWAPLTLAPWPYAWQAKTVARSLSRSSRKL